MSRLVPIIGHLLQQEQLQNDIDLGNVSHAYLFSGPAHIGKHALALRFACDLLSVDVSDDQKASVRHSVEKLTHPDLFVLDQLWMAEVQEDWDFLAQHSNVPQAHRQKNKAKTDVIGIDDIRALKQRLYETGIGTYRCCIITSIERMHAEAANAFLKMLEEPPQGLVFVLTTQSQGTLLPTVTSRSRILPFSRVAQREMLPLLEGITEEDRAFIFHLASGAPGMVMRLKNDPDFLRLHRTIHSAAQSFWRSHSLTQRMSLLSPLSKRGEEAERFLLHLGLALREQGVHMHPSFVFAFQRFARDLSTNAHRQLLAHRFVLELFK